MKESVIKFVRRKFKDITDKGGNSYFKHCEKVAITSSKIPIEVDKGVKLYYIGMLHDILEDTSTTIEELKEVNGVTEDIIDAIKALTRNYYKQETYFEYIERVSKNELARIVKICDLRDNMDVTRLPELTNEHFNLLKRYHKAYNMLIKNNK